MPPRGPIREESGRGLKQTGRGLRSEDGQGVAEYGLILALIVLIALAALLFLGPQISSILSAIAEQIQP
jgi:pilus assembly protein Flp/PilA